MRNIRDKLMLVVVGLVHFGGHVIQRIGKITHFVFGLDVDRVVQIAVGKFSGSARDLVQGPYYPQIDEQKDDEQKNKKDDRDLMHRREQAFSEFKYV